MVLEGHVQVDLSDAILLLKHLFLGDGPPVAPYPVCGRGEVSAGRLPCASYPGCSP